MVWYLRRAGAATIEAWEATTASAGPMAGLPWVAAGVAVVEEGTVATTAAVVGGGAAVAAVEPGLDP